MNTEPIGQPVRSLQIMLRTISQYDSKVLPIVPDGIYSGDTMASVTSFQKRHNLPVTGVVDIDTWYSVVDEFHRALVEIGPAEPINPIFQPKQVIRAKETNEHLYMIHGMMLALSDYYSDMPRVTCSNIHDDASVESIRWLQERAGIEPTGNITRLTWKHLARLYRITVGDGTPPSAPGSPQSVTRPNDAV